MELNDSVAAPAVPVFIILNGINLTLPNTESYSESSASVIDADSSTNNNLFWYRYNSALACGALIAAYGLVFIAGLIGNVFVIIAVVRSGGGGGGMSRHCTTNIFFANLAVADLLVIIACLPFTLISNLIYRKSFIIYFLMYLH